MQATPSKTVFLNTTYQWNSRYRQGLLDQRAALGSLIVEVTLGLSYELFVLHNQAFGGM
jgi:hypothetical protein